MKATPTRTSAKKHLKSPPRIVATSKRSIPRRFAIVGVGASAGGLESFIQLLSQLPARSGLAFVFVQHLDPTHPSLLTEILSRATTMPVVEAQDGKRVRPNHLYVLPSNFELTIKNGALKLHPHSSIRAPRKTIDVFLQSLALDRGPLAIGVALSGNGADGAEGLRAIKAEGGITLAQTPKSAKYDGIPRAAIAAGGVDLILPPEGIAEELVRIAADPRTGSMLGKSNLASFSKKRGTSTEPLDEIIGLLKRQLNIDFSNYKKTTLSRRVDRRMLILKQSSEKEYAEHLKKNPAEAKILFAELLIHVTNFFRDPKSFEALKNKVFPRLIKDRPSATPIRIWVPGCSTGEEAYSIAISLLDFLGDQAPPRIQIFASDISDSAIQKARQGVYPESSVQNIPKPLLEKYFTKTTAGYKIVKSVRELCLFSKHDLISHPPFAKVDLISCRNLLIYFNATLQRRIIPLFHYALNPTGFLFLGHSESVGGFNNLFRTIDKNHKIYEKKPSANLPKVQFLAGGYNTELGDFTIKKQPHLPNNLDIQIEADRLVALKYGPCGVVVNDDLEVLQFRGRTVPYLEQAAGVASYRLLKMAHPDLVLDLKTLLQSVKSQTASMRKENVQFENEGHREEVHLEVIPLRPSGPPKERQYLILFEKAQAPQVIEKPRASGKKTKRTGKQNDEIHTQERLEHLERQLLASKQYQQALIEGHEADQEEVAAANEELQSANEELQSTNEELETAKEELQSTNEELITVNEELHNRNNELGIVNNDLLNLLGSIEIPILIVGGDYRIRRFTPAATRLLNLIATDIGRPLQDIRFNLDLPQIDTLISEVIEKLKVTEMEVQDQKGHWYRLQIRPYRTTENKIDGVVMAFVDIESLKTSLDQLEFALNYATSVADALQVSLLVVDRGLRVKSTNQLFCDTFSVSAHEIEGHLLAELEATHLKNSKLKSKLEHILQGGKGFHDFEITCDLLKGQRVFLVSAKKIRWADVNEPEALLLSLSDVTARKEFERNIEESEIKYRTLLSREQEARGDAEKANRTKDVFLATLSHELRTPLSSILTWSQLIKMGKVDAEKIKVGATVIEQSAKAQSQLIDDLLDISRIAAGKLALEIKEVDFHAVIPLAVESVRAACEKKSIQIDLDLREGKGKVLGDPIRMQQIIWNLLTNAVKFSPKGSRIIVRLDYIEESTKRWAQIQVIDEGKGIPVDFLPHIFSRFSQADSTSTRVHGGLGLGLSIVRNLTELQGGHVRAENAQKGSGAIFTVSFPVTTAAAIVQTEANQDEVSNSSSRCPSEDMPKLDGLRILFVDDDESTREATTVYLTSFGAQVLSVDSVQKALKALESFHPNILVSDIAMPDEDGYDLIRKVRKLTESKEHDIPAIALTAFATAEDAQQALQAGFQAHLAKPVEANYLARAILKWARR